MARRARPSSRRNAWAVASLVLTGCGIVAGLGDDRSLLVHNKGGAGGSLEATAGTATVGGGGVANAGDEAVLAGSGGDGVLVSASGDGSGGVGGVLSRSVGGSGGTAAEAGEGGSAGVTPVGSAGPSCAGMNGTECSGDDCCESLRVPGGVFPMGRSVDGTDAYSDGAPNELPEHLVQVSPFTLDKYEITVGRFRRFMETYDGTPPPAGAGANPHIPGSGWQSGWPLPSPVALRAALSACDGYADPTWTPAPSYSESLPLNCIDWYAAFAFCIWDGGRLPTAAEWEFAAAGGSENRLYPWGEAEPNYDLAAYNCSGVDPAGPPCATVDIINVGSRPDGNGRWGHADLADSMMEMTRDSYDSNYYPVPDSGLLVDPADLSTSAGLYEARGGNWVVDLGTFLRAAFRNDIGFNSLYDGVGARCARDLPQ
jgi:sulfatase modifying factor 1